MDYFLAGLAQGVAWSALAFTILHRFGFVRWGHVPSVTDEGEASPDDVTAGQSLVVLNGQLGGHHVALVVDRDDAQSLACALAAAAPDRRNIN